MPMTLTYATRDEFKEVVRDERVRNSTDFDTIIDKALFRSEGIIDDYLNRREGLRSVASVARTFDGVDRRFITVPDIQSISLLEIKDATDDADWETVTASDYFLRPQQWDLKTFYSIAGTQYTWPYYEIWISDKPTGSIERFYSGYNTIRVTAVWGWPAVPAVVNEATLELAVRLWRSIGTGFSDAVGVAGDDTNALFYIKQLSPLTRLELNKYRLPGMR